MVSCLRLEPILKSLYVFGGPLMLGYDSLLIPTVSGDMCRPMMNDVHLGLLEVRGMPQVE